MLSILCFNQEGFLSLIMFGFFLTVFKTDNNSLNTTSEIQTFYFQKNETICDSRIEFASFILWFCPLIQSTLPEFAYGGIVRDSVEGLAEVIAWDLTWSAAPRSETPFLLQSRGSHDQRWSERAGAPLLWIQTDGVVLFCSEKWRFQGDLTVAFKYIKGPTEKLKWDSLQGSVRIGQEEVVLSWKRAYLQ